MNKCIYFHMEVSGLLCTDVLFPLNLQTTPWSEYSHHRCFLGRETEAEKGLVTFQRSPEWRLKSRSLTPRIFQVLLQCHTDARPLLLSYNKPASYLPSERMQRCKRCPWIRSAKRNAAKGPIWQREFVGVWSFQSRRHSLHNIPRDSVGNCLPAFTPCYRLNSFRVVPLRALDKNSLGTCMSVLNSIVVMGEGVGEEGPAH